MEMTFDQAMRPGLLQAFAMRRGSGYMMRSEKRGGAYGGSNRRPPKRKKAGFVYIFLTLLISIVLWPIGMVMLWRRKVRLQAGTKLLISLLTLCLSVFLIVFALTVPVDNPQFTAFQDKANDWLDKAAVSAASAGDATMKKSAETWNVITDFAAAEAEYTALQSADAIDKGVELAGQARAAIEGLFHKGTAAPDATEAPADTDAPATDAPADTEIPATEVPATEAPADTKIPATEVPATDTPSDTEIPTTEVPATDTPVDTEVPATETPADTEVPADTKAPAGGGLGSLFNLFLPAASPDAQNAQKLESGTLHADGSFEPSPTEAPTEEATEVPAEETATAPAEVTAQSPVEKATEAPAENTTEAPTEAPAEVATEAPAEVATETPAEVATEAPAEVATEAPAEVATEAPAEQTATAPALEVTVLPTEEATEVPADTPEPTPAAPYTVKPAGEAIVYFYESGSKGFHKSPTQHDMQGAPAHTLAEAFAAKKNPCVSCGMPDESILSVEHIAWVDEADRIHTTEDCDSFVGHWRLMSLEDALEAGCAPCADCGADLYAEDICPAPTATPEPEVVHPAAPLKSAGEITVYYFEKGRGYHVASDCVGMSGAPAHTLAEALADGKHPCGNCFPPSTDLIGLPVLWLDEAGVCHTSDECAGFTGKFKLIDRDEALEQGLAACPDCGAAEYLKPGTVLADQ